MRYLPVIVLLVIANQAVARTCTYTYYTWNTITKEPTNLNGVTKPYSDVTPEERDRRTGCTVCEEDQVLLDIPPIKPFKLCRVVAPRVENILKSLIARGEPIVSVIGYRVGKTRGQADEQGNRTQFSNHSFGVALDVNEGFNGLYDDCLAFSPKCRLIRGGAWSPGRRESFTEESPVVRALESAGLLWGGRIQGKQKDFMHFSPTGY